MTQTAGEYRWSSYRSTALGGDDPLLTPHDEYLRLGRDAAARRYAYRELFRHHMDDSALHDIREALNQELVLGSERFKDRIDQMVSRRVRPGKSGRPRVNDGAHGVY
jgi:putative transposase